MIECRYEDYVLRELELPIELQDDIIHVKFLDNQLFLLSKNGVLVVIDTRDYIISLKMVLSGKNPSVFWVDDQWYYVTDSYGNLLKLRRDRIQLEKIIKLDTEDDQERPDDLQTIISDLHQDRLIIPGKNRIHLFNVQKFTNFTHFFSDERETWHFGDYEPHTINFDDDFLYLAIKNTLTKAASNLVDIVSYDVDTEMIDIYQVAEHIISVGTRYIKIHTQEMNEINQLPLSDHIVSSALYKENTELLLGTINGEIIELSVDDLSVLNQIKLHENAITSINTDDSKIVTSSIDQTLMAWDESWNPVFKFNNDFPIHAVYVLQYEYIIGDARGRVITIDKFSNSIRTMSHAGEDIILDIVANSQHFFAVGLSNSIFRINRLGNKIEEIKRNTDWTTKLMIQDEKLFVISYDGSLTCLNQDLERLYSFNVGSNCLRAMANANKQLIIGSAEGRIFRISEPEFVPFKTVTHMITHILPVNKTLMLITSNGNYEPELKLLAISKTSGDIEKEIILNMDRVLQLYEFEEKIIIVYPQGIYILDTETYEITVKVSYHDYKYFTSSSLVGDVLYVVSNYDGLHVFDVRKMIVEFNRTYTG